MVAEKYEVESIDRKCIRKNGSAEYLIKWKGYEKRTWQPLGPEDCPDLFEAFEKEWAERHAAKPAATQKKRPKRAKISKRKIVSTRSKATKSNQQPDKYQPNVASVLHGVDNGEELESDHSSSNAPCTSNNLAPTSCHTHSESQPKLPNKRLAIKSANRSKSTPKPPPKPSDAKNDDTFPVEISSDSDVIIDSISPIENNNPVQQAQKIMKSRSGKTVSSGIVIFEETVPDDQPPAKKNKEAHQDQASMELGSNRVDQSPHSVISANRSEKIANHDAEQSQSNHDKEVRPDPSTEHPKHDEAINKRAQVAGPTPVETPQQADVRRTTLGTIPSNDLTHSRRLLIDESFFSRQPAPVPLILFNVSTQTEQSSLYPRTPPAGQ